MPHALTVGLTEYWFLDEASGNRVGIVGGKVLAPAGTPLPGSGAGKTWTGATFGAAATSRLELSPADSTAFQPGMGSLSVQMWVNYTAFGADRGGVAKYTSGTATEWRLFYQNSNTQFRWQIANTVNASITAECNSTTVPVAGRWYHVVGTFDAATQLMKTYVNGKLERTVTPNAAFAATGIALGGASLLVGNASTGASTSANGTVDLVAYWSRALTAFEVQLMYNNGNAWMYPFNRAPIGIARIAA